MKEKKTKLRLADWAEWADWAGWPWTALAVIIALMLLQLVTPLVFDESYSEEQVRLSYEAGFAEGYDEGYRFVLRNICPAGTVPPDEPFDPVPAGDGECK